MRLTGAQIIAQSLVKAGVPYAIGIPGHGSWCLTDAFLDAGWGDTSGRLLLTTMMVMHEQSAVHVADGYFRVTGRPLAAFTSIGPGSTNTIIGMATAFVDSSAVLLLTGSTHTYMRGHAVMQELDRAQETNNTRIFEPVSKRQYLAVSVEALPHIMHRAFNTMLSGRPGPVHLDLPMDVQADTADVEIPDFDRRVPDARPRPDADLTQQAARLLYEAKRPVIVAGGGVILSAAAKELVALAEHLGAAVVTTWQGKGAIPEDHPLNAWGVGTQASHCGNQLASSADVLLAVGCRFVDWTSSSFRQGVTYTIPPTKLIHLDIDPSEIGKNYPAEIGLVADAKAGLTDLLDAVRQAGKAKNYQSTNYFADVQAKKAEWDRALGTLRDSDATPATMARVMKELRAVLDREAIVTSGAGLAQGIVRQAFPVYGPRTHITSGGFSTMGFTVPAAIGAQLAHPGRQVVGCAGDGDFMQTMQEMAVAAMYDLPALFMVLNNSGFISIKGGQTHNFGRTTVVDFQKKDGTLYSPNFCEVARAFGLHADRISAPGEVQPAVRRALATKGPALIEVIVDRELGRGVTSTGWWDMPIPEYLRDRRAVYEKERGEETIG
ncbi:MAG: thiamine pyrophosphate-binding protein [Chloroflexi bacterium]|nr:thiamine pyrophosphate-binding protein [Chloroflexota bacterium]